MRRQSQISLLLAAIVALGGISVAAIRALGGDKKPVAGRSGVTPSAVTDPSGTSMPTASSPSSYRDLFTREAYEERRRASRQQGKLFVGTINGIRVGYRSLPRCVDFGPMRQQEIQSYQLPMPKRIPNGAVPTEENGYRCGDAPYLVDRVFQVRSFPTYLTVARIFNSNYLVAPAGERRVSPGMIQGRPAVFVRPLTPAGESGSWIAFMDGDDLILFEGIDLRFADLRAAAESLPL